MLPTILIAFASGGELLFDDELQADVALRQAGRTVQTDGLQLRSLRTALATPAPWRSTGASLQACATDAGALTQLVREVELAIRHVDYPTAMTAFDADLPCAPTIFERQLLARAWFLKGYIQFREGNADSAEDSFAIAARMDSELVWDDTYPPVALDLFNATAAAARADTITLRIVPVPQDFVVDGARVTATNIPLTRGAHVIQWSDQLFEVDLSTDETVYIPDAIGPGFSSWVADPEHAADVDVLLKGALPNSERPIILHDARIYRHEDGGWAPIKRPRVQRGLVIAGGTTFVAGAATAIAMTVLGQGQSKSLNDTSTWQSSDYGARRDAYLTTRSMQRGAGVVAGVGAALTLTGLLSGAKRVEPFEEAL